MKAGESGLDNKDHSFVETLFLKNVPRTERASVREVTDSGAEQQRKLDSEGIDVFAASECSQEPELEFDGSCTTGTLFACGFCGSPTK